MRLGVVAAGLLSAVFVTTALAARADQDTGRFTPPAKLSAHYKAVWMGEWVACKHTSLRRLAAELNLKVPAARSVQVTALIIAKTAEAPLWNIKQELDAGIDGCRNGILWRFYHP